MIRRSIKKNPPENSPKAANFQGFGNIVIIIIIKKLKMSRGKKRLKELLWVAHSRSNGVSRAEIRAGGSPCPDTPHKSGWGVGGAKPPQSPFCGKY